VRPGCRRLLERRRTGVALVGLELVEDRLDLPALGAEHGELAGGGVGGVQDGGHEPVGGAGGPRVILRSRTFEGVYQEAWGYLPLLLCACTTRCAR
jgi:hypothetical protein